MAFTETLGGPPAFDFGSPTIFFDSHPEEQDTYIQSYWTALKSSFHIAFTGQVPKFHEPGHLRLIWWTNEGTKGMKDYELHEYGLVRDNFDVLLAMPEVRRAMIMGYSGQNPYLVGDRGSNPWQEKFGRDWARIKKEKKRLPSQQKRDQGAEEQDKTEEEITKERQLASKEGRVGKDVDMDVIEKVIDDNDRDVEEARRIYNEKVARENKGKTSGDMV